MNFKLKTVVLFLKILTCFISHRTFGNLLLTSNGFTSHYVYIKDFNRLMFNKTKNKNKKYFL